MKHILIYGNNLPNAYHNALTSLETSGDIVECPDWNQKQKELSMTVHISDPIAEPRISKLFIGGPHELQQYEMEMLDGILDFEIQPEKGKWSYTYHNRYEKYYSFIVEELKRNPYSRRAVISIRDNEEDIKHGDPACFQNMQFMIRENKLDMFVLFRSNDLPEAFFMNAWALIKLQEKIAQELCVDVGTYTHTSNSMHCYEKNFKLLHSYTEAIQTKQLKDLTYMYNDDWKDIMHEEIPSITKSVENLKENQ